MVGRLITFLLGQTAYTWGDALRQMIRRVQVNKCHYNSCAASTGIPEGDPISVVGMFGFSYLFSVVVDNLSNFRRDQVLPATYADNWEIVCARLQPILQLYLKVKFEGPTIPMAQPFRKGMKRSGVCCTLAMPSQNCA